MNIRYAHITDTASIRQLWETAFGAEEPYTQWYFSNVYRPDRTLCGFIDSELVTMAQFAPYTMSVCDESIPVVYLVGVATAPQHQKKGYSHRLLRQFLDDLSHSSYQMALLYTDIPNFYRPLGFNQIYNLRNINFRTADAIPADNWQLLTPTEQEMQHCDKIYRKMCSTMDGYILRGTKDWFTLCEAYPQDKGIIFGYSCDAYALCMFDDDSFILRELGYNSKQSMADGLNWTKHQAKQHGYESIIWRAPIATDLPVQNGEKNYPYVMALLLDARLNPADTAAIITEQFLQRSARPLWISEMT